MHDEELRKWGARFCDKEDVLFWVEARALEKNKTPQDEKELSELLELSRNWDRLGIVGKGRVWRQEI
jgi:hypothetical protein